MSLQFTPEAKARLEAYARRYPQKQAALLPALHLAQGEFGHLSLEVQSLVAETLGVPHTVVHEVTTFYEMFHQHAEGQFHLEICTNISCHLLGADSLVDHCKRKLGIEVGHQTEDGVFGLMEAECLASCGSGPMMRVGFDYYEYLTPEALDSLIERFKKTAPSLKGKGYVHGPEGPHVGAVRGFEPKPGGTAPVPKAAAAPAETTRPSGAPPAGSHAAAGAGAQVSNPPAATSVPTTANTRDPLAPTADPSKAGADLPSFTPPGSGKKDAS